LGVPRGVETDWIWLAARVVHFPKAGCVTAVRSRQESSHQDMAGNYKLPSGLGSGGGGAKRDEDERDGLGDLRSAMASGVVQPPLCDHDSLRMLAIFDCLASSAEHPPV